MSSTRLPPTAADWLSLEQLAERLGIGVKAARHRCKAHDWPHIRAGANGGGGYRFLPEHVEAIKARETQGARPSRRGAA